MKMRKMLHMVVLLGCLTPKVYAQFPRSVFFRGQEIGLIHRAVDGAKKGVDLDFLLEEIVEEKREIVKEMTKKTLRTAIADDEITLGIAYSTDKENKDWLVDINGEKKSEEDSFMNIKINKERMYLRLNKNEQVIDMSEVMR
jgi:hypothetical protein